MDKQSPSNLPKLCQHTEPSPRFPGPSYGFNPTPLEKYVTVKMGKQTFPNFRGENIIQNGNLPQIGVKIKNI